jgi:hypothetical protein
MTADIREHIRWLLTREPATPMQDVDNKQSTFAVVAAFTVASERALGESPSAESIRSLVQTIRGTYVKEDSLQPVQAEAVIRAAFGEEEFLKGIPYTEMMKIQLSVTYGILQHLKLSDSEYEDFLRQAEERAVELAAG